MGIELLTTLWAGGTGSWNASLTRISPTQDAPLPTPNLHLLNEKQDSTEGQISPSPHTQAHIPFPASMPSCKMGVLGLPGEAAWLWSTGTWQVGALENYSTVITEAWRQHGLCPVNRAHSTLPCVDSLAGSSVAFV